MAIAEIGCYPVAWICSWYYETIWQLDTPRKAGGLMRGAVPKAVPRNVRHFFMPSAARTPKGLTLSPCYPN